MMEDIGLVQGPLLDALNTAKNFIWYNGFWWGVLAGFIGGIIFAMLARVTMKD